MKRELKAFAAVTLGLALAPAALATNGDIMEGIGPISTALGGTGVAAPQDAISAIVNNPAALGEIPGAAHPELDLGVTLFQPVVKGRITTPAGRYSGGSKDPLSLIPYMGYAQPLGEKWNLGLGAYGVSGMGVNYRTRRWDLDGDPFNGYEGALYSKFSSMKTTAAASYRLLDSLSIGLALQGNYSELDLGQNTSHAFGGGAAAGLLYRLGDWRLGASYTMPQNARFRKVYNFDAFMGDESKDTLDLEQPAIYALGAAWVSSGWLVEFNTKYLQWSDTEGYGDFDWRDQLVYAAGVQRSLTSRLDLRLGFNYARNPVREHHGWDPMGATTVQGKQVPTMGYELLRNVGFPGIVETHAMIGLGYRVNDRLSVNTAYMHAFEKSIHSRSAGNAFTFASDLTEHSLTFGISWLFD